MTGARILACLLFSGCISTISINAMAAGDATAGQEKSQACQGCHGLDGNSFSPEWPSLASQHQAYLIKQVHDFQSGARENETMSPMVAGLPEEDILDIAAYFASQTIKPEPATESKAGKKIFQGGNAYTKVPACASCHGPNGIGNGPGVIPHLAGQKAGYTAKALQDYKTGLRSNDRNSIMADIAARLTDGEISALADFIASMGTSTQ